MCSGNDWIAPVPEALLGALAINVKRSGRVLKPYLRLMNGNAVEHEGFELSANVESSCTAPTDVLVSHTAVIEDPSSQGLLHGRLFWEGEVELAERCSCQSQQMP